MPSTNAAFPVSARSMMSPPGRGWSRIRLPFLSSTPSTTKLSGAGLPSCSRKKSTLLLPQHPDIPEGPVQLHKFLRRQRLAPLQDLPRPRIGGPHLLLLLVREGHDVQDEQLIDLGPVEQVARALRGDLGIVIEDDGGGEHLAPVPFLSHQYGPRLQVLARSHSLQELLRGVRQRDKLSSLHLQRRVG